MYRIMKHIKWILEASRCKACDSFEKKNLIFGRFSVVRGPLCTEMDAESSLTRVPYYIDMSSMS